MCSFRVGGEPHVHTESGTPAPEVKTSMDISSTIRRNQMENPPSPTNSGKVVDGNKNLGEIDGKGPLKQSFSFCNLCRAISTFFSSISSMFSKDKSSSTNTVSTKNDKAPLPGVTSKGATAVSSNVTTATLPQGSQAQGRDLTTLNTILEEMKTFKPFTGENNHIEIRGFDEGGRGTIGGCGFDCDVRTYRGISAKITYDKESGKYSLELGDQNDLFKQRFACKDIALNDKDKNKLSTDSPKLELKEGTNVIYFNGKPLFEINLPPNPNQKPLDS